MFLNQNYRTGKPVSDPQGLTPGTRLPQGRCLTLGVRHRFTGFSGPKPARAAW